MTNATITQAYTLYVTHPEQMTISSVDTLLPQQISQSNMGFAYKAEIVLSPDGKTLYVTDSNWQIVKVIDADTFSQRASIPFSTFSGTSLAASPDGSKIYVGYDNKISIVDTTTDQVTRTVDAIVGDTISSGGSTGLAVSKDGSQVYATGNTNNSWKGTNIFTAGLDNSGAYATVGGTGIAVNQATGELILSWSGSIFFLAPPATASQHYFSVGPGPNLIAITTNGKYAYVSNCGGNSVSVIDTAAYQVIKTIEVGKGPLGVAISPDDLYAFVANNGDGTISCIEIATNTVMTTISVPASPCTLAVRAREQYKVSFTQLDHARENYFLRKLIFGLNKYVAVGSHGGNVVSDDGITWQANPVLSVGPDLVHLEDVVCNSKCFVALGYYQFTLYVYYSADGAKWLQGSTMTSLLGAALMCIQDTFYVYVSNTATAAYYTSKDGANWTAVHNYGFSIQQAYMVNGLGIGFDLNNNVLISTNGMDWSQQTPFMADTTVNDICWSPTLQMYVAACKVMDATGKAVGAILTSTNGYTWGHAAPFTVEVSSVCWNDIHKILVAVNSNGDVFSSLNATYWSCRSILNTVPGGPSIFAQHPIVPDTQGNLICASHTYIYNIQPVNF